MRGYPQFLDDSLTPDANLEFEEPGSHSTRKTWMLVTNRDEESSNITLMKQENSEIIKYKRILRLHSGHIWGVSQIDFWFS